MQDNKKTIVFTGGHAGSTGYAVVEQIRKEKKQWNIHWIGTKKAVEAGSQATFESRLLPSLQVKFHSIKAGRLQRKFSKQTIPSLFRIPKGFIESFALLRKIKPDVVVSFGGFAAVPVVITAWLRGIPVVIHEQTAVFGLANRVSAPFSRSILIARESSREYANPKKTVLIGNPIRADILKVNRKKAISNPPVVFITGGSRGSVNMNSVILAALASLQEDFKIIHHTGEADFVRFKSKKSSRYTPVSFVKHMEKYYHNADIIISRGGANTLSEIMYIGRPALIIPIPWTRYNEQEKNADMLVKRGIALKIHQDQFTEKSLLEALKQILKNWDNMATAKVPVETKLDKNASINFVKELSKYLV